MKFFYTFELYFFSWHSGCQCSRKWKRTLKLLLTLTCLVLWMNIKRNNISVTYDSELSYSLDSVCQSVTESCECNLLTVLHWAANVQTTSCCRSIHCTSAESHLSHTKTPNIHVTTSGFAAFLSFILLKTEYFGVLDCWLDKTTLEGVTLDSGVQFLDSL